MKVKKKKKNDAESFLLSKSKNLSIRDWNLRLSFIFNESFFFISTLYLFQEDLKEIICTNQI
jgi:hypothetical protein